MLVLLELLNVEGVFAHDFGVAQVLDEVELADLHRQEVRVAPLQVPGRLQDLRVLHLVKLLVLGDHLLAEFVHGGRDESIALLNVEGERNYFLRGLS